MTINRSWAMPSQWTFSIPPIAELLSRYVGDGKGWIDPFAGKTSPAELTNDLNPATPATFHLPAVEFCNNISDVFQGVLFDPPYSPRQIKECYDTIGLAVHMEDTQNSFYSTVKNSISPKIVIGGYAICCGWNSGGFGKGRGFEMIEILLVAHGGNHNDTIVTVEKKTSEQMGLL